MSFVTTLGYIYMRSLVKISFRRREYWKRRREAIGELSYPIYLKNKFGSFRRIPYLYYVIKR
jgi:hypothetical protein